jgi:C1A family cysteine protease
MSEFCGRDLNHGVLVVGYSRELSNPYYIIKNSWGSDWGMGGYIQLALGENKCGVADDASYPEID